MLSDGSKQDYGIVWLSSVGDLFREAAEAAQQLMQAGKLDDFEKFFGVQQLQNMTDKKVGVTITNPLFKGLEKLIKDDFSQDDVMRLGPKLGNALLTKGEEISKEEGFKKAGIEAKEKLCDDRFREGLAFANRTLFKQVDGVDYDKFSTSPLSALKGTPFEDPFKLFVFVASGQDFKFASNVYKAYSGEKVDKFFDKYFGGGLGDYVKALENLGGEKNAN